MAGGRGPPAAAFMRRVGTESEEPLPGKGYLRLKHGDVVSFVSSGGGGFGR